MGVAHKRYVRLPLLVFISVLILLPLASAEKEKRGVYTRHTTHKHVACAKKPEPESESNGFPGAPEDFDDDCIPYACIKSDPNADKKTREEEDEGAERDEETGEIKIAKSKCDPEKSSQSVAPLGEDGIKEAMKKACEDMVQINGGQGQPFSDGYRPPSAGKKMRTACKNAEQNEDGHKARRLNTSVKYATWGFPKVEDETKKDEGKEDPLVNHVDCLGLLKTLGGDGPGVEEATKVEESVISEWVDNFMKGPPTGTKVELTAYYRCDFKAQGQENAEDDEARPNAWNQGNWGSPISESVQDDAVQKKRSASN